MVFLHGCDLFDRRYYWEAHEMWEEIWHAAACAPRPCPVAAVDTSGVLPQGSHGATFFCADIVGALSFSTGTLFIACVVGRLLMDLTAFIGGGDWPLLHACPKGFEGGIWVDEVGIFERAGTGFVMTFGLPVAGWVPILTGAPQPVFLCATLFSSSFPWQSLVRNRP